LWEAAVADDGTVGGYAYTLGWSGYAGSEKAGHGDFHVILIDGEGKLRLDHVTKRQPSNFANAPPNPVSSGLFLDPAGDRVVVRVDDPDINRCSERWWIFRISTGNDLGAFRPKELMPDPKPARYILDARPLAGTTLTLVHWWRREEAFDDRDGARFTLVDPLGNTAWSLEWPSDYHVPGDENAELRVWRELHEHGAILRSDQRGQFDLWCAGSAERVTFSITTDAAGRWFIREKGRHPYAAPAKVEPPSTPIPEWRPRVLGRITLRLPGRLPAPMIRDVYDFVFDGRGRIALIRSERDDGATFLLVDQQGKVLQSLLLPAWNAGTGPTHLAWVDGDRFLILRGGPRDHEKMIALGIDVATGRITAADTFSLPKPSKIASFRGGGFAAISLNGDEIAAFDARGARGWALGSKLEANDGTVPYIPTDIAITTQDKIAVVNAYAGTVQLFDRNGKHERTIKLQKAWKFTPSFPSEIIADVDGGYLVHDHGGTPPLIRMTADGSVRALVVPTYADGRRFRLAIGARVAPDGRLWTSDGYALLRLNGSGTVAQILGEPPQVDRLDGAAAVSVDSKGRIYAVAGRTGTIHVFDADGRRLRALRPDPRDVPAELHEPEITVSDSGDVFMAVNNVDNRAHLHFAPDGRRIGVEALALESSTQPWLEQPGSTRRWVVCPEAVLLVDRSGKVNRTVARRFDRNWLESITAAAVGPDGSIAIVAHAPSLPGEPYTVNVYTAQGDPVRTFPLPDSIAWSYARIAYNARHLVIAQDDQVVAFEPMGDIVGKLTPLPAGEHGGGWTPFLTGVDHWLWLFDGGNTLYRFAMPKAGSDASIGSRSD
jgi:hypothetical protein